MLKKFNVFALALLIIGQTILGPMAVSAESITPETFEDELETSAVTNFADTGDEGDNLDEAFATAVEAVEKAEKSKKQEDIDAAQILVDALEDSEEKGALQVKLDALAVALATDALEKAEESQTQEDVDAEVDEQAEKTSDSEDIEEEEAETEEEQEKQEQTEVAPVILNDTDEKSGFKLEIGKVTDFQGNEYTDDKKLNPADEFSFNLDWRLENGHTYTDGDSIEFDLPKQVYIHEEMTDYELKDGYGEIIAHYTVTTDNKIKLTFTDYVDKNSDVEGFIGIEAKLNPDVVEIVDGEVTIEPIGDGQQIVLPVNPPNHNKEISKSGKPATDYNADEIKWTVTANGSGANLKDAKVIDNLPEGLAYKEGSLKIIKYKTNLLGEVVGEGEDVTSTITPEIDGQLLTIPLGDTKDKYIVEYTTEITDPSIKNFKNDVKLVDENKPDVPASSTVPINRGEPIKKNAVKGYDPVTGIIEWEIEFNYDQKSLQDVTLSDTWKPAGKIALEGDVEIIEVTIDGNGQAAEVGPVELGTVNNIEDGFEVTGITTDKAYKVKYKTKVKDRVIDGFTMDNVASFGDDNKSSRSTGIGQYYGVKTAGNVNYNAKTIDWNITLNQDKRPMKNIAITDTFTEGQTLKAGSVKVTIGGVEYPDYTLTGEGENSFSIEFPENHETSEVVVITYKSDYDPNTVGENPENTANIEWIPENSTEKIKKDLTAGTNINWKNGENHWKNGTYNPDTKKITWTLIVNYRGNAYKELIVKDTPEGNQKLVTDSIKVEELEIEANGNEKKVADVESPDVTVTEDGFTLDLGETEKTYKVIYETSIADAEHIQASYENAVEVSNKGGEADKVSASVGIPKANEYSSKIGKEVGKTVEWKIDVNPGQHNVTGLTLTDTISDNQAYLQDTITVYEATVDGNGNAIKGEPYNPELYELVHEADTQTFEIKWKNEIDRAFVVEYSTLFFANKGEAVTNDFKVTGENLKEGSNQGGQESITIDRYDSSGGSGKAGFLIIDKVDKEGKKLAGATFELRDNETGKVLMSGVTDEEGQISFGRLRFDDYTLVETETPEGYVAAMDEQMITINKEYHPETDKKEYAHEVENYVPVFAIDLLKTGNNNEVLPGAEFALFDSKEATEPLQTITTNEDGKILFKDLEKPGTYYVQEMKAPAGYILDKTKHEVTIGEKEPEPVEVSVNNTPRGAVQLTKTDKDTNEPLEGVEFELQKKNDSGEYELVKTYTTDENGQIQTENTLEAGDYQFAEKAPLEGYRTNVEPKEFKVNENEEKTLTYTMTNEKFKGSVKLIKKDAATKDLLKGAEFKLVDSEGNIVEENLATNDAGEIEIGNLLLGKYHLIETKAPTGYELDETPIDVEITEDLQVVEKTMTNNKITDISVEKKWNNAGGDTKPVTVKLLPTDLTAELNEGNDWQATFKDLHVYDKSGEEIDYQVEEIAIDGYKSTVTGDSEAGFIVTNTELTGVTGTKTWLDDESDQRPDSITVVLSANGEKVDELKVDASSDWKYEFADLEKYDKSGEEIKYTIDEVKVPNYKTSIKDFDITNLRVGKTEVSGTKTWLDDESENRPGAITVNLLANGEKTDKTVEVTAESEWEYEFTDLDQYDDEGKEIVYTIDEEVVAGYEKSIDNHDLTNLRVGTTVVEITKLWKDEDATDRPETITVNLLQNNIFYEEYDVTKENGWKLTITDLPQYDEEGKVYNYTITEHDVPGYASAIDELEITNTRVDMKPIKITKAWLDNDSKDRPVSIEVELFRSIVDGEKELVETITVTAADEWVYERTDLPAFDADGQAYEYEIEEKTVEGYETSVNGFDITNVRAGETSVEGTKTWKDDNASDRPDLIQVDLLQNGKVIGTQEVNAEADWKYSFSELTKYDDEGVEYKYEVKEQAVEGYESTVDSFDITNTRVGTISVEGTKTWKDDNATDRPETIIVNLLQNGVVKDTKEVKKEGNWSYIFEELDEYDENGKTYEYTVKEQGVPGYKSEVDGFNITNIKSEKTSVPVTKGWKDGNATDRPDSIQVNLLRNGEPFQEAKVTAENEWTHEFTDLEAYDEEGVAYEYTIEEVAVKGYETKVDGYDITNTRVGITSVEGTKTWKDDNATDRPEMIKVDLLQNGEVIDTVEVTAETGWEYSFGDLAEFDENGVAYAYTVKEQPVAGYTSTVDGYNITNTLNPVEPGEPTGPVETENPNKPTEPSKPGDNGNIDKPGSGDTSGSGKLPQTGEEQFKYMIALGVLLLVAGGIVLFRQRRAKA